MGTRSLVAMELIPDKKYQLMYCHYDGYPTGVGKALVKYYNTPKRVEALLDLSSVSAILPTISRTLDTQHNDIVGRYIFDTTEYDLIHDCPLDLDQEYIYLWKNGKWYWFSYYNSPSQNFVELLFGGTQHTVIYPDIIHPCSLLNRDEFIGLKWSEELNSAIINSVSRQYDYISTEFIVVCKIGTIMDVDYSDMVHVIVNDNNVIQSIYVDEEE